ncbi:MAG: hypothetical protein WBO17_13220 [Sphingorhabdus sp.]
MNIAGWSGDLTSPNIGLQIKERYMTLSSRTQIASVFAAILCAFITIGMSVAPAIAPVASVVA